jgi:hypothetical protein
MLLNYPSVYKLQSSSKFIFKIPLYTYSADDQLMILCHYPLNYTAKACPPSPFYTKIWFERRRFRRPRHHHLQVPLVSSSSILSPTFTDSNTKLSPSSNRLKYCQLSKILPTVAVKALYEYIDQLSNSPVPESKVLLRELKPALKWG